MLSKVGNLGIRVTKKLYIISKKTQFKLLYGNKIKMGNNVSFLKGFKVIFEGDGELSIGAGSFFNFNCSISCLGKTSIGQDCLFGENVKLYDHNHRFSNSELKIKDQGFKVGEIKIGDNCWLGSNVTVLNNVTIGDNVIIGANCLISKSVPSNSIVRNGTELMIEERRTKNSHLAISSL